jgi:diaminopimelate epimerase
MIERAAPAFTLMHGAHNAFAVLDEREAQFGDDEYPELARLACAQFDVDGVLVVRTPAGYGGEMRIFNRDGSESEMCGNGLRCVVRYLAERAGVDPHSILTKHGEVPTAIVSRDPFTVRTEIGRIAFPFGAEAQGIGHAGAQHGFVAVSVGNPHAVVFFPAIEDLDMNALAQLFAGDPRFPYGVNVHAAVSIDGRTLRVRHHERGVGETQACGSGAVAVAAAAIVTRGAVSPVTVLTPGGALTVAWEPGKPALLEGPAEFIGERTLSA